MMFNGDVGKISSPAPFKMLLCSRWAGKWGDPEKREEREIVMERKKRG
jgi:hypothetical protein